jgi:hypothetical protein
MEKAAAEAAGKSLVAQETSVYAYTRKLRHRQSDAEGTESAGQGLPGRHNSLMQSHYCDPTLMTMADPASLRG